MTQPLPGGGDIEPLLYERGFAVWAIAPPLAPPPDLRLRAQDRGVVLQAAVRPDVIAASQTAGRFAVTECKASSFGAESSNAEQARSLLIVGGPRCSEVLGISDRAVSETVVAFLMPEDQRDAFSPTLSELDDRLTKAQLSPGPSCILGLRATATGIVVVSDVRASAFFGLPRGPVKFLGVEKDTSPAPLYFIPYDPTIDQSPAERQRSKRMLFERLLGGVISATGRANPPFDLLLEPDHMLNDAMFGMYEHWESRDATRHMRRLCREFMNALLGKLEEAVPGVMKYEPQVGWHVVVGDEQEHKGMLDSLMRFSCEEMALGPPREPELFDAVEDC
jgi:hypothetical protein